MGPEEKEKKNKLIVIERKRQDKKKKMNCESLRCKKPTKRRKKNET